MKNEKIQLCLYIYLFYKAFFHPIDMYAIFAEICLMTGKLTETSGENTIN